MVELKSVLDSLEELAPCYIKEEWDNVGLMVGSKSARINKIIVALDCTMNVINEAIEKNAELIITHHPFIFNSLSSIDFDALSGSKIKKLIENKINVISMHTNLDKAKGGVNDALCEALGLYSVQNLTAEEFSLGRTGELKETITLKEFVKYVKEKLNVSAIKYVGNDSKIIKKVSVISGSGGEFYKYAIENGSDVFVTSEVKHNIGIEVMEKDFAIIDAGHFETENIITEKIKKYLDGKFDVDITKSESYTNLFKTI